MPKKQADGRYRAKLTIGYTGDGKPIHKYVSGRTKRELEDAKQEAFKHYVDGTKAQRDMQFGEYAIAWYRTKKEPYLSESSKSAYLNYYNNFLLPAFGDRMMRSIQSMELQEWLNQFAGKSKTFITMVLSIVRAIFTTAHNDGILQWDIAKMLVRPKPGEVSERRALTVQERSALENVIHTHRHGLLLAMLYYLGVRRGEALGLQWGDFDWKNSLVQIRRDIDYSGKNKGSIGELKTKASSRDIPMPEPLLELLAGLRRLPHIYLFSLKDNKPLSRTAFQRRWMELMIAAGLANAKTQSKNAPSRHKDVRLDYECEITPHYLRHNYATVLYDAGVDPLVAMRLLGHADYSTTVKIYTHLHNMHVQKAGEKINDVFSKTKVAEKLPEL